MYSNITAPPTTPPPPPPSTQPGSEPRLSYDDPYFRPPLSAYWSYLSPYPYYPPYYGYGYSTWQSPPFGPPPIYVMPPVWPGWTTPTATTSPIYVITTPAATLGTGQAATLGTEQAGRRRRGFVREEATDSGEIAKWWWPTDGSLPKRPTDIKLLPGGGAVRPSPWDLAASVQGYPLNEAAREQYKEYVDQFMKERYYNLDLRKLLEIAKDPPQWHKEMWEKYGGEPEWYKEHRQRMVEMLPGFIEKYQPEPLQRPAGQATQTQPPATQAQVQTPATQARIPPITPPIWEREFGGRET